MGYESRVYLIDVHRHKNWVWAETIAEVRMAKMYENAWYKLFSKDIDYTLIADDGNTSFDTDMYGEHLKSCPVGDAVAYLEERMKTDPYRRLPLLYGLLAGINPEHWDHLELVHFGY